MKIAPAILACGMLVAAAAPASAFLDRTGWSALGFNESVSSRYYADTHVTPTLRRQKVTRILALRDEAVRLQAKDGGTLSPKNLAYIRQKAIEICYGRSGRSTASACPNDTLR